jgi:hypothetical protein
MTLVTAASRGQDISIGETATITSAVFVLMSCRHRGHPAYDSNWLSPQLCCRPCSGSIQRHLGFGIQGSADGCIAHPLYRRQVHSLHDRRQAVPHSWPMTCRTKSVRSYQACRYRLPSS